jgi:hypothetical protein
VLRERTLEFPFTTSLIYARLAGLRQESHGARHECIVDYDELHLRMPPALILCQGKPFERVAGHYVPRRLRFLDVPRVRLTGVYAHLAALPADHPARFLRSTLHWRPPSEKTPRHLFIGDEASVKLSASRWTMEERPGPAEPVAFVREWSPSPPLPARLVQTTKSLHHRYGGDPITIRMRDRAYRHRLFVGGLECQGGRRPSVDFVLNLSENPSRWCPDSGPPSADRWVPKGEGKAGMPAAEIVDEAHWVLERLRAGSRVLVHCTAGFNRSVTVCCGALILLEGLSAEAALARVREHHPWSGPDSHHWLALRWLAHTARR